jgi:hypothetical protein
MRKLFIQMTVLLIFILVTLPAAQEPILDENGRKTGLVNMNPDPNGEPWIAGGDRNLTQEELDAENEVTEYIPRKRPLPLKVDNSTLPHFRAVFSQGGTASCAQASAIGYLFTYEINCLTGGDASLPENQFSFGFTYNLFNRGSGDSATSVYDGWLLSCINGLPTVEECGFFTPEDMSTKWLSGYDAWYNGMQYRISPNGIWYFNFTVASAYESAKSWLTDHEGTTPGKGGLLLFSCWCTDWHVNELPAGGTDPVKTIITRFGRVDGAGHAICIAGYNDEIEYDLDDNGTIEDHEKGAFLIVNSWGDDWGNKGKAYVPYHLFSIPEEDGGVKYQRGRFIYTEIDYKTNLTYKINIQHAQRNKLSLKAGVAVDTNAAVPDTSTIWDSPHSTWFDRFMNYSGGAHPMQGRSIDESIELGFDASFLLDFLGSGPLKLFFQIDSKGGGTGTVNSWSVIDYAGTSPLETACPDQNVSIMPGNAATPISTYLSLIYNYNGPPILSVSSPQNGEGYLTGMEMNIQWGCTAPGPIKIVLNDNGIEYRVIAASTENDGELTWSIPHDVDAGSDYSVSIFSVNDLSLTAVSKGTFTINKGVPIQTVKKNTVTRYSVEYCNSQLCYTVPVQSEVHLGLYDIKGKLIRALVSNRVAAGSHTVTLRNMTQLSAGIYLCRMTAPGFTKTVDVAIVK